MSTQSSGVPVVEKAEVHTESMSIQQHHVHAQQPIDLAPRPSSVVQLRTVGPFSGLTHGTLTAKTAVAGGPTVSGITATIGAPASIISVNRNTPLTILPARSIGAPGTPAQNISRYQIARLSGNVRSANLAGGQQPASITVTPIASNFRLTGATVNNGSWIQTGSGAQGSYTPIRATTITVGRGVRNDGKMIHIPQQGSVQHVTQLQMVDNKVSMLKPPLTATPIVNLRAGSIHPQGSTNTGTSVALAPFTIRATNLTNLPIQQRPPTANTNAVNPNLQKVITQPTHGPNLHLINAQKLPHAIQTLTPLPRLCLTLSSNGKANLATSNSAPVVAVASRQNVMMTPSSLNAASAGNSIPIGAKVFPVSRDGSSLVESIFAQHTSTSSGINSVALSGATAHTTMTTPSGTTNVMLATTHPSNPTGSITSQGQSHPHHHLVQLHGLNMNTSNTQNSTVSLGNALQTATSITPGTMTSGYYVEKSVLQHQPRPITIEKRPDVKNIVTGSMILTTQHPNLQTAAGQSGTVTIPLTAHGFAHPIPMSNAQGLPHAHLPIQQGPTQAQILTSLAANQSQQIPASISMLTPLSSASVTVSGPTTVPQGQQSHLMPMGAQVQVHAIPTHVITQPVVPASPAVTGTTTNSSSINTSVTVSVISTFSGSSSTTTSSTISSVSVPVPVSTTATTCPNTSSSANANTLSTSTPVQSPSQAKSTLSPRPSILRKREVADCHSVPLRAQRNLALNFSVNNAGTGASVSASASAAAAAAAAANKENTVIGVTAIEKSSLPSSGISILKKEFQPPNEESSWQSCSSNSSSGSTTISTTSETAEIQMQQQIQQHNPGISATSLADLTASLHHVANNSNSNSSFASAVSMPNSQNGIVRSSAAPVSGKAPRNSSSAKMQSKDLDRIKCKEKEDCVSPRKKPRKQQLTTSEFMDTASPEISIYQGSRLRKNDILNDNLFEGFNERLGRGLADEPPPTRMVYYIKKPHMSLLQSNKITSKPRQNHFHRHCDVKPKEERRPTVSDLANQKNVTTKVSGWKLQQMSCQVDKVIDMEENVVTSFTTLLSGLDNKVGPNCVDRDLNRIQELLKGNIQRCKVIRDQMSESRSQVIKILDHKPLILDVINKYISKRPIKKRERL